MILAEAFEEIDKKYVTPINEDLQSRPTIPVLASITQNEKNKIYTFFRDFSLAHPFFSFSFKEKPRPERL